MIFFFSKGVLIGVPYNFVISWSSYIAGATNKPQELDDAVLRRLVSMLMN